MSHLRRDPVTDSEDQGLGQVEVVHKVTARAAQVGQYECQGAGLSSATYRL